jgi:hypothetical protein
MPVIRGSLGCLLRERALLGADSALRPTYHGETVHLVCPRVNITADYRLIASARQSCISIRPVAWASVCHLVLSLVSQQAHPRL